MTMASNIFSPVSTPVRSFNRHCETATNSPNTPSSIASSFLGTPNSAPRRQYPVRQRAKSIADSHTNWRTRAGQAGIKVGPYEGDDEESEEDQRDESEQSLLPPADVLNRPRAASTMSSAPPIMRSTTTFVAQDSSPLVQRVARRNNMNNMATPPRNNTLLARRGWVTDPQQPRPRVSPNVHNNSSRLFDISEDAGELSDEESMIHFGNILDSNNGSFDDDDDLDDAEYYSRNSFSPSQPRIQQRHASILPQPLVYALPPQQQFIHANYPTPATLNPNFFPALAFGPRPDTYGDNPFYNAESVYQNNHNAFMDGLLPRTSTPPPPGYSPNRFMRGQSMKNGLMRSLPSKEDEERFYEDSFGPVPEVEEESEEDTITLPTDIKSCGVCGETPSPASSKEEKDASKLKLAVLAPCLHSHCSHCITSALNVVGEKELECGLCRGRVAGMKLIEIAADVEKPEENESINVEAAPVAAPPQTPSQPARRILGVRDLNVPATTTPLKRTKASAAMDSAATSLTATPTRVSKPSRRWDEASSEDSYIGSPLPMLRKKGEENKNIGRGKSFFEDPLFSSPGSKASSASEANYFGIEPTEGGEESGEGEMVVLRIDNVPWDITPPLISSWLATPGLVRCHVLLDPKGKTKSHAYVECGRGREGEERGKIVLRGVTGGRCGDLTGAAAGKRSGILGKGRRARGVTVTRSGEEELLRDLFPTFPGSFTAYAAGGQNQKRGCKPTLAGLPNYAVRLAFERGLVGDEELAGLVALLRDPGSHFLKTPSLPFYLLASMLSKYPADEDSRVLSWGAGWRGRDSLFDVTVAALEILHGRLDMLKSEGKGEDVKAYDGVLEDLVGVAQACRAFTEEQKAKIDGTITGWEAPAPAEVATS